MRPLLLAAVYVSTAFAAPPHGPFTDHFSAWLKENGYGGEDYDRLDYGKQGSFGGRIDENETLSHYPIVFIHGNSDAALRVSPKFAGWEFSIGYFLQQNYTSAELYATSYGDHDPSNAFLRTHNCAVVKRLRRFVEAVKKYTGAKMVNVITHSLGVTLGRKVIKGGPISAIDGSCNIGPPLTFVDVFIGIAGGNWGLCSCTGSMTVDHRSCNVERDRPRAASAASAAVEEEEGGNGFWPGESCGSSTECGTPLVDPCNGVGNYSSYLHDLNADLEPEGKRIVSLWSTSDELIDFGDSVWGRPTSLIPRSTDQKIYQNFSHMETKELTVEDQFKWINRIA